MMTQIMRPGLYVSGAADHVVRFTRPSPSVLGHSKSRNGKWEMKNGKRGNGEMERQRTSFGVSVKEEVECTCCAE